jgi:hypothetical protein
MRIEAGKEKGSMTRRHIVASLATVIFCSMSPIGHAATLDFESVPPGTAYGTHYGNLPGETVLSQDGIDMYLEHFMLDSFIGFNRAEVGGRYDDWFSTTPLELDNISVGFDFSGVGFDVTRVTLEFQEFGGSNSFAVNGSTSLALPSGKNRLEIAPDVFAYAEDGFLVLAGRVDRFEVGGQELSIDNLIALPEPTAAVLVGLGAAWFLRRRRSRQVQTG